MASEVMNRKAMQLPLTCRVKSKNIVGQQPMLSYAELHGKALIKGLPAKALVGKWEGGMGSLQDKLGVIFGLHKPG